MPMPSRPTTAGVLERRPAVRPIRSVVPAGPIGRWRRVPRWLVVALLLGLSCGRTGETETDLRAQEVTDRVQVFLIASGDGGAAGLAAGCGDSAVPVEVKLGQSEPALRGALRALLGMRSRLDPGSGLYNALYASPLALQRVERAGAEARVYLTGYVEIEDGCDGKRALAQLTETVLQFPDVQKVQLWLNDKPLRDLLAKVAKGGRTG